MPRHEKGYRSTALHELFHVYQLSSIADPSISKDAEYRLMGKRMGNSSVDVPWWMEGTATYLAHYFYDQQPGAAENSLYDEMRRYLTTDYNGSGLGPIPDQYKNAGKPLTESHSRARQNCGLSNRYLVCGLPGGRSGDRQDLRFLCRS